MDTNQNTNIIPLLYGVQVNTVLSQQINRYDIHRESEWPLREKTRKGVEEKQNLSKYRFTLLERKSHLPKGKPRLANVYIQFGNILNVTRG